MVVGVDAAISGSSDRSLDVSSADARASARNLFLTGFLVLFLELACIRWFATTVIFLQFFSIRDSFRGARLARPLQIVGRTRD